MVQEFSYSKGQEPHRDRTRQLLRSHPEVRLHIGKNPYSFLIIVSLVALQIAMSFLLRDRSWWEMGLGAFFVGAFASHALWVMIHECAHNLIFAKGHWNMLAGMLANLPHVLPSSVSFQSYHLKHHAFQGIYDLDADLPSYWEARLIGCSAAGKAVWLLLFPLFQVTRPPRLKEIPMVNGWIAMNMAVQMIFNVAVYLILGPQALMYLFVSFFFSVGLHPLGARWIQEHYLVSGSQETYSYYGPLNTVAFNVGYHNEHHDLPSVPWNRLPEIRKRAPELYDSLEFHTSWTRLLLRFIFDPNITLFSRRIRTDRGGMALNAELKPELGLVSDIAR
jgi:sphingolipid delta-4 desaturase